MSRPSELTPAEHRRAHLVAAAILLGLPLLVGLILVLILVLTTDTGHGQVPPTTTTCCTGRCS